MWREEKVSATTITSAKGDNPQSRQEFPVIIPLVNGVLFFRRLRKSIHRRCNDVFLHKTNVYFW